MIKSSNLIHFAGNVYALEQHSKEQFRNSDSLAKYEK